MKERELKSLSVDQGHTSIIETVVTWNTPLSVWVAVSVCRPVLRVFICVVSIPGMSGMVGLKSAFVNPVG